MTDGFSRPTVRYYGIKGVRDFNRYSAWISPTARNQVPKAVGTHLSWSRLSAGGLKVSIIGCLRTATAATRTMIFSRRWWHRQRPPRWNLQRSQLLWSVFGGRMRGFRVSAACEHARVCESCVNSCVSIVRFAVHTATTMVSTPSWWGRSWLPPPKKNPQPPCIEM